MKHSLNSHLLPSHCHSLAIRQVGLGLVVLFMAAAVFVDGADAGTKKKKKKEKEQAAELSSVSMSSGLTVSSAGTLTLTTSTYSGNLSVGAGSLIIGSASWSLIGPLAGSMTIDTGISETVGGLVLGDGLSNGLYGNFNNSGFSGDVWYPFSPSGTIIVDTAQPTGGTMALSSGSNQVDRGGEVTIIFSGWTDPSAPLLYEVLIGDVVVSSKGNSSSRSITAPNSKGVYTVKGRIYDSVGNVTEVQATLYVATKPKK